MTPARGTQKSAAKQRRQIPDESTSRPATPRAVVLAGLLTTVLILVLIVHWPVLSAHAVSFDDTTYLFDNPVLQKPGIASAGLVLSEVLESSMIEGYYEPLTLISLMMDVAAGGRKDNLTAFHRTSLVLHLLNTAMIIVLLYLLFHEPWPAAVAGLLFGLHPLTVEPIAWVWERKTLLSTFFALACLIAYVRYVQRSSRLLYIAAVVLFVLALMAKPTVTALPVILLLLDFWPLKQLNGRRILEKIPFFIIAGISAIITVISTARNASVDFPASSGILQIPLKICYLLMFYAGKMIWPTRLSSVYMLPEPISLSQPVVLASLLGLCMLAALVLYSLRWTRAAVVGVLFFVLTLSPTLGVIGYSWVCASDKYMYLPAIGMLLILTWLLVQLWNHPSERVPPPLRRGVILFVVLILAATEAVMTQHQLTFWRNRETLCRRMVDLAPGSSFAHNELGLALAAQGKTAEAIGHYQDAIRLDRDFVRAYNNLGIIMADQGRFDEAVQYYRETLRLRSDDARPHNNLGNVLAQQGKAREAIQEFEEAIRIKPLFPKAHNNLGLILTEQGDLDKAAQHYKTAIDLNPDYADPHNNLGIVLVRQNKLDEAIQQFRQAREIKPDYVEAINNTGLVLSMQRRTDDAIRFFRQALDVNPGYLPAQLSLADELRKQGNNEEANATYRRALQMYPNAPIVHLSYGIALEEQGIIREAVEQYRQVLELAPRHPEAGKRLEAALQKAGAPTPQ